MLHVPINRIFEKCKFNIRRHMSSQHCWGSTRLSKCKTRRCFRRFIEFPIETGKNNVTKTNQQDDKNLFFTPIKINTCLHKLPFYAPTKKWLSLFILLFENADFKLFLSIIIYNSSLFARNDFYYKFFWQITKYQHLKQ